MKVSHQQRLWSVTIAGGFPEPGQLPPKSFATYRKTTVRRTQIEPVSHPDRKVYLPIQELPLHTNPRKSSRRLIDPVPLSKDTNSSLVRLKLPRRS